MAHRNFRMIQFRDRREDDYKPLLTFRKTAEGAPIGTDRPQPAFVWRVIPRWAGWGMSAGQANIGSIPRSKHLVVLCEHQSNRVGGRAIGTGPGLR
jgi:hypothetical protein